MTKKYFVSLQYSAIQKTILRHDRLWSMAGISALLSELNEITLPEITQCHGGEVLVAGGGKFTAAFSVKSDAQSAKEAMIEAVAVPFPMLEFQISSTIVTARTLEEAKEAQSIDGIDFPGLVMDLNEQKRVFRGSGLSFNPHLKRCDECCEYPATDPLFFTINAEGGRKKEKKMLCRSCYRAWAEARIDLKEIVSSHLEITSGSNEIAISQRPDKSCTTTPSSSHDMEKKQTTIKTIYSRYCKLLSEQSSTVGSCLDKMKIPLNFEDLFSASPQNRPPRDASTGWETELEASDRKRMAVWFSDINNMNGKVPIWLSQEDEKIFGIFETVKAVYIDITAKALAETFNAAVLNERKEHACLPFRLIIAGGDDLCLVMDEKYVMDFAVNLSDALHGARTGITKEGDQHCLSTKWLEREQKNYFKQKKDIVPQDNDPKPIKPYSFGAAFVITDTHTPFSKIHSIGEELMGKAKKVTDRWDNSVNWCIMAEDENLTQVMIPFEKPLFIDEIDTIELPPDHNMQADFSWLACSFKTYIQLRKEYGNISTSHRHQIVKQSIAMDHDSKKMEQWLIHLDSAEQDKSFSKILTDDRFRDPDGNLRIDRIMTLFELLSINTMKTDDTSTPKEPS